MAVSKTQNERPAIIGLIDAVNMTEPIVAQNVQNIATLTQGLADEVSDRETADTQLERAIQDEGEARAQAVQAEATARAQAVQGVQNQIGEGIFSPSFTITQGFQQSGVVLQNMRDAIRQLQARFRMGLSADVTVAAGGSTSDVLIFEPAFDSDAEVAVFPVCVGSGMTLDDLSCKVTRANYQGFSFDVYNGTQAEVTIKVGFLAVKVN